MSFGNLFGSSTIKMLKHLVLLVFVHLIKAQYGNSYRDLISDNFQRYSSDEDLSFQQRRSIPDSGFKRNMEFDYSEALDNNEEFNNGVEPKSIGTLIDEVQEVMGDMKIKLNDQFRQLSTLDQQNQEKAKKTLSDTRAEIENRIRYVEQLLYKKREGTAGSNVNVMQCVSDSLTKLGRISPELMKDEERCISSEMDMSRAVSKVTLDMLKENLHKVKLQQERLNKCNSMYKRKKLCLVSIFNELSMFKKTVKTMMSPKMAETVTFLTELPSRMRTCSSAQVAKVVNRAGDVIMKFNNCVKNIADKKKKNNADLLLFVV